MFNKDRFKELLEMAMGDKTITEYAKISDVNRTYISKYVNKKLDTPPSSKIIKKLADTASNNVTYKDLMEAAGHINNDITIDYRVFIEDTEIARTNNVPKDHEELADKVIDIFIKTGELKEGEKPSQEKEEKLLELLKKAIEISKL